MSETESEEEMKEKAARKKLIETENHWVHQLSHFQLQYLAT